MEGLHEFRRELDNLSCLGSQEVTLSLLRIVILVTQTVWLELGVGLQGDATRYHAWTVILNLRGFQITSQTP